MYCPDPFAETRPEILRALIQRYPLATLVSMGGNGLEANHIPLYLAPGEGPQPLLRGHVARANPLWREAPPDGEVLVIFQGPQHYITSAPRGMRPRRKPARWCLCGATSSSMPTVRCTSETIPLGCVNKMTVLTRQQKQGFAEPWEVADVAPDFTERCIEQVIGIEIPVSRLLGKWKASQNQPLRNRESVMTLVILQAVFPDLSFCP